MTDAVESKRERGRPFQREAMSCLPAVARFALSLTRDEADVDDLVQETYLRAYRAWDRESLLVHAQDAGYAALQPDAGRGSER